MATSDSVKQKIKGLISRLNQTTGEAADDLTSAVNTFLAGYGRAVEVSTEEKMTAILESATDSTVGSVYKYTGETTDTYTSGEHYIVEVSE